MAGHKFDPARAAHLHSGWRSRLIPAGDVLASFHPQKDEVWAEAGAGTGFFILPLAAAVTRVNAIDVNEQMLDILRERVADAGADNVELLQSREDSLPLDDASVDAILMAFLVHELDQPEAYLAEAARAVRADGRLCIVEFGRGGVYGPPADHRVSAETVRGWAEAAGFSLSASHDWSRSLLTWRLSSIVGWEFRRNGQRP